MGRLAGFVGVIAVLAIGLFIYSKQVQPLGTPTNLNPTNKLDATGVRMDLVAIANAEKRHFASDGKYVSLDELRQGADANLPTSRKDFTYTVELTDNGFRGVATYTGNEANALHTITIDQDMKVSGQN